ncbi:hypothetical protein BJV74DRAFT_950892 [Russula compacta]|nr:hypothetical protein BJV74DRAFT_950892 [Russula compacta]
MLLLRPNSSLPDLDASSLRLRSSSYPSYNTIPSKQFTHSPSEEVLPNYVHTTPPSQPPFSMYSLSHDQREGPLIGPWLPSAAGPSADVSQPADASSTNLPNPSTASRSTYSPSHSVSTIAPLPDPTRHARFHHTPTGSPSARHQSFSSQHHPGATEARYQHQQQRRQHRQSFQHSVTPVLPSPTSASFSADRRPSTAGSASSGWEPRGDILAEPPLQGVTSVTPAQDLHQITAGDQNTPPVERYAPAFSNPFSEHSIADTRPRSSGVIGPDPLHSESAQDEHDSLPHDSSLSKTYSFVSLPGNAVRKRPRRRYDEIERLYHCSWTGCTKSYGTLNHLNAHIVMQRHGNKRTPAEFKELRKQWRKAKKDESDRLARLERVDERFSMRPEHAAMQYPPQPYERQPRSLSYMRQQQLYGPGMPGPEMDHQLSVASTPAVWLPYSGAAHSLYPVVPAASVSSWPEQSTQYEGTTPPQHGSISGHAHVPAQTVYEYERERQGQSWTPPSHPPSRPVPPYEASPSYAQPQPPQRTLAPDSTLLTPLPGYQPPPVEPEYEEEYDGKQQQQFWTEQQQQQQQH